MTPRTPSTTSAAILPKIHTQMLVFRAEGTDPGTGNPPGTVAGAAMAAAGDPQDEQNEPFTSAPQEEQNGIYVYPPPLTLRQCAAARNIGTAPAMPGREGIASTGIIIGPTSLDSAPVRLAKRL